MDWTFGTPWGPESKTEETQERHLSEGCTKVEAECMVYIRLLKV